MFKMIATDQDSIPRVFGIAKTKYKAKEECLKAVEEYHADGHRPDVKFRTAFLVEKRTSDGEWIKHSREPWAGNA